MKRKTNKFAAAFLVGLSILLTACGTNNSGGVPSAVNGEEFGKLIQDNPSGVILDVRSEGEFSDGHLAGAKNVNWNGSTFENETKGLSKNDHVFVYCLSGGRSSSAASYLRGAGFKKVVELKGGLMAWREAKLTNETGEVTKSEGMTSDEFNAQVKTGKVLVDFNAVWCGPCKRMAPFLKEIEESMKSTIKIMSIDADENNALAAALKVDALPTLFLYQDGKVVWSHVGYISKEELIAEIEKQR